MKNVSEETMKVIVKIINDNPDKEPVALKRFMEIEGYTPSQIHDAIVIARLWIRNGAA